jgi:hypothetical protein
MKVEGYTQDMHETTDLYRRAFQYAGNVDSDITIFAGAMFCMMRDRTWESGWIDQVHGDLVTAPSLRAFIERPVPKGINKKVEWVRIILKAARDLGDTDAEEALELLEAQLLE